MVRDDGVPVAAGEGLAFVPALSVPAPPPHAASHSGTSSRANGAFLQGRRILTFAFPTRGPRFESGPASCRPTADTPGNAAGFGLGAAGGAAGVCLAQPEERQDCDDDDDCADDVDDVVHRISPFSGVKDRIACLTARIHYTRLCIVPLAARTLGALPLIAGR